jgi:hypothetical protein
MKNEVDEGSIANARDGRFFKIAVLLLCYRDASTVIPL